MEVWTISNISHDRDRDGDHVKANVKTLNVFQEFIDLSALGTHTILRRWGCLAYTPPPKKMAFFGNFFTNPPDFHKSAVKFHDIF